MIKTQNNPTGCGPTDLEAIVEEEMLNVIYDDYGGNTFDGLTMFEPSIDEFFFTSIQQEETDLIAQREDLL